MRCTYHLDREALSVCASCGLHFCNKCLHKGGENYYCDQPECKERWLNIILPAEMDCPSCGTRLDLNEVERCDGLIDCPACKTRTDLSHRLKKESPAVLHMPHRELSISDAEKRQEIELEKDLKKKYSVKDHFLNMLWFKIPAWLKRVDDDYIPD